MWNDDTEHEAWGFKASSSYFREPHEGKESGYWHLQLGDCVAGGARAGTPIYISIYLSSHISSLLSPISLSKILYVYL